MARMTRKELLKEPDEFITTTGSVLMWIKEHPTQFMVGAVVLLSILSGGYGLYYWKTSRDLNGMNAYLKASGNPQMSIKVAQDYAGAQAGKLAKLRLARMSYEQGDFSKALSYADEFLGKWSRKDTFHWQAALIIASSHINKNEPAKALPILEECMTSASQDVKDQALILKATVLLSQGKDKEAGQALSAVSENYQEIAKTMLASRGMTPAAKTSIQPQ